MEVCKEFNIEWVPTKNFVTERFPYLFKYYVLAPLRKDNRQLTPIEDSEPITLSLLIREACSLRAIKTVMIFFWTGLIGEGSI